MFASCEAPFGWPIVRKAWLVIPLLTAAIVVQGWYGSVMVHGIDHMNW